MLEIKTKTLFQFPPIDIPEYDWISDHPTVILDRNQFNERLLAQTREPEPTTLSHLQVEGLTPDSQELSYPEELPHSHSLRRRGRDMFEAADVCISQAATRAEKVVRRTLTNVKTFFTTAQEDF